MTNCFHLDLPFDTVEYLLSVLDEYPQDSPEYAIREEILLQVYE
tara:strand:+ start:285 stop:416 length:132 start_codon:yes stop_codon:yes gene_type:complete